MLSLSSFRGYTPRYRLRAAFADKLLDRWHASGRFIEVGSGTGDFLKLWAHHGLTGVAHEISDDVMPRLRTEAEKYPGIDVEDQASRIPTAAFDYLFAFEVLEHIEGDHEALRAWSSWLRPGGTVLISVPARMRYWTESDDLVGHVRRYEKQELQELLAGAGFRDVVVWTYGFPVTALTRRLRSGFSRRVQDASLGRHDRTLHSALASLTPKSRLMDLAIDALVLLGAPIQMLFAGTDRGDGYMASGTFDA